MRKYLFILPIFVSILASAQEVNWVSFEKAQLQALLEPKPILVFIHTSWCKYCLLQENNSFTDSAVVNKLNDKYYCIKLNAESKDSIRFLGKTYLSQADGYHELANYLGSKNGKLVFPTTVFLSSKFELIFQYQGLLRKKELLEVLK